MKMYEELVKSLREHANYCSDCYSCVAYDAKDRGYNTCSEELAKLAADAIESMCEMVADAYNTIANMELDRMPLPEPPKEEME